VANVVAGLAHCAVNRHSASARSCGFSEAFLAYRSCVFAAGIGQIPKPLTALAIAVTIPTVP
jgi:hypothetical protein